MSAKGITHWQITMREVPCLFVLCALLTCAVYSHACQNPPERAAAVSQKDQIADWIEKAREDNRESIFLVVQLADAGATQAIPMLEEKFARTQNELTEAKILSASVTVGDLDKANIARSLVKLGDKNDIYWDFLLRQAMLAIDSDIPEYLIYDPQGKAVSGPSPKLVEWAKNHKIFPPALEEETMFTLPAVVDMLGRIGDPRATPLLRRALQSSNYRIQIAAAKGLAKIQDKDSIPLIISACQNAPAGAAFVIAAGSLAYFDDPKAQSAAETYIPAERLKALHNDKHLPGSDPFK